MVQWRSKSTRSQCHKRTSICVLHITFGRQKSKILLYFLDLLNGGYELTLFVAKQFSGRFTIHNPKEQQVSDTLVTGIITRLLSPGRRMIPDAIDLSDADSGYKTDTTKNCRHILS